MKVLTLFASLALFCCSASISWAGGGAIKTCTLYGGSFTNSCDTIATTPVAPGTYSNGSITARCHTSIGVKTPAKYECYRQDTRWVGQDKVCLKNVDGKLVPERLYGNNCYPG